MQILGSCRLHAPSTITEVNDEEKECYHKKTPMTNNFHTFLEVGTRI